MSLAGGAGRGAVLSRVLLRRLDPGRLVRGPGDAVLCGTDWASTRPLVEPLAIAGTLCPLAWVLGRWESTRCTRPVRPLHIDPQGRQVFGGGQVAQGLVGPDRVVHRLPTEDSVGTRIDCQDRFHLSPDSLVVQVLSGGSLGFDILPTPAGATALTVDHLPAYMQELAPDDPAVGADTSLVWTLSNPGAEGNFYMISALVRGPDLGPIKAQLRALIASLRHDPPVAPSPQPSGASATPGPTR
jgi:hypothetical protein